MKLIKNIIIPATSGKELIAEAKGFEYIDPDFKDWNCLEKSKPTKKAKFSVYELDKDLTFEQMFGELGDKNDLVMTQSQILKLVKKQGKNLLYFYLFKSNGEVFVAAVCLYSGGRPYAGVRRFSSGRVWHAECRPRIVVPQLKLKTLCS